MATDSFKFWDSYLEACEDYTDEEFGALIRALAKSVFFGEEPDFKGKSKFLKSTFFVMRGQAEQSRKIAATARENGRKSGGRPSKNQSKTNRFNEKKGREEKGNESSLPSDHEAPPPLA